MGSLEKIEEKGNSLLLFIWEIRREWESMYPTKIFCFDNIGIFLIKKIK